MLGMVFSPSWSEEKKRIISRTLLGILLLFGLVVIIANFGDIDRFITTLRESDPLWIVAGLLLQGLTYLCVAITWKLALKNVGVDFSVRELIPLSVAKLFSDQVMPSGGISGSAFFITVLSRRGVAPRDCVAALIGSLLGYYSAYVLMALGSLVLLAYYHDIHPWILTASGLFFVLALVIPVTIIFFRRWSDKWLHTILSKSPSISFIADALAEVPPHSITNLRLFAEITVLQTLVFLLDSATLWAMLLALGQKASLLETVPCLVVASMVATIGLIPLGIGTFETSNVALLFSLRIPFEIALAGTLLLRGLTLWMPMIPGMWLAKKELSQGLRSRNRY